MKKNFYFMLTALVCALFACTDNAFDSMDVNNNIETRAIVDANRPSESNPDLIANWENGDTITLNTIFSDERDGFVTTLWTDGVLTSLSDDFRTNIKKKIAGQYFFTL